MRRKIYSDLLKWKSGEGRLPLILHGARQVGKTYLVRHFGRDNYRNTVRIDFENNPEAVAIFDKDLNIKRIVRELEAQTGEIIHPSKTLLFFDEIQSAPRVLTSLKYFAEDAPEYHVVAAGSLLGVAINREGYSFPVGKVQSLRLYPFSFEEFLLAMGEDNLTQYIAECVQSYESLGESLHNKALDLFKEYLIVGGMPASILSYRQNNSFLEAQKIMQQILNDYLADMSKYASKPDSIKIRAAFESIPEQLARENKKFKYSVAMKNGTAERFANSIDWLIHAGLVIKCNNITNPISPLRIQENRAIFKLYLHDVGMLTLIGGAKLSDVLKFETVDITFLGAVAENYVASALNALGKRTAYWTNKHEAEIDFLIETEKDIVPIEVKKGKRTKSHSLSRYMQTYHPRRRLRISAKNFGEVDGLISVPIYATEWVLRP